MSETISSAPAPEVDTSSPDVDVSSPESIDEAELGAVQWQILEQFVENDSARYEGESPTLLMVSLENDVWKFEQGVNHDPDRADIEPIVSKDTWDELFDLVRGENASEFEGLEGQDFIDALRSEYNKEHGIIEPDTLNDDLLDIESDPDIDAVIGFLGDVEKGDDPIAAVEQFEKDHKQIWDKFSDDEKAEFADMVLGETTGEDETQDDAGSKIRDRIDFNEQIRLRSEFPQFDDIEDPEDRQEIIKLYVELEKRREKLSKSSRKTSNYILSPDGYRKAKKKHMSTFRGFMTAASKYRDVIPGMGFDVDRMSPEQREKYEKMTPEEERNAFITSAVIDEVHALESLRSEAAKNSKANKFIGWWNTKSKWTKMGVGAVVGFGAVTAAGMTGGVAAAFVAGGAARLARGTVNKLSYQSINAGASAQFMAEKIAKDTPVLDLDTFNMYETIDMDVKERRKANRRAVAWGAGSVAVGGALSYGLDFAMDTIEDPVNSWIDNVNAAHSNQGEVSLMSAFEEYPNPMFKVGYYGYTEDDAYFEFIERGLLSQDQAYEVAYNGASIADTVGADIVEEMGIEDVEPEAFDGVTESGASFESDGTIEFSQDEVQHKIDQFINVESTDPFKTAVMLSKESSLGTQQFLQMGMDTFESQYGISVNWDPVSNVDTFSFGEQGLSYKSAELIELTGLINAKQTLNEILIEIATQNMR